MSRISAGSVIRRTAELFLNRAVDVLFLFTLLGMSVSLVTRLVPAGFEAAVAVLGGVLWVMFAASMLHIFGGDRRERSIGDMYESSYRGLGWTTVQLLLGLAMTAVTGLAVAGLPVLFRRSGAGMTVCTYLGAYMSPLMIEAMFALLYATIVVLYILGVASIMLFPAYTVFESSPVADAMLRSFRRTRGSRYVMVGLFILATAAVTGSYGAGVLLAGKMPPITGVAEVSRAVTWFLRWSVTALGTLFALSVLAALYAEVEG